LAVEAMTWFASITNRVLEEAAVEVLKKSWPSLIIGLASLFLWYADKPASGFCLPGDVVAHSFLFKHAPVCHNPFGWTMFGTVGAWLPWAAALVNGLVALMITLFVTDVFPKLKRLLLTSEG
jgi:hypothetical protein